MTRSQLFSPFIPGMGSEREKKPSLNKDWPYLQFGSTTDAEEQCRCRWFFFRVTGVRDEQLHLNIVNAGEGSFPTVSPHHLSIVSSDVEIYTPVITSIYAID